MYCRYCGANLESEEAKFCNYCGKETGGFVPPQTFHGASTSASAVSYDDPYHYTFDMGRDNLPRELRKPNWGAYLLNWIWAIGNGVWWYFVPAILVFAFSLFLPVISTDVTSNIALWSIYYALDFALFILGLVIIFNGNNIAWKSRKWRNVYHFQHTQLKWAKWGFFINMLAIIISIILMVALIPLLSGLADIIIELPEYGEIIVDTGLMMSLLGLSAAMTLPFLGLFIWGFVHYNRKVKEYESYLNARKAQQQYSSY